MNNSELMRALLDAMEKDGVRPLEPLSSRLAEGRIVRFRAEGDRAGRRNGWARLWPDGWAFGHWRLGVSQTGKASEARAGTRNERLRWERELIAAKLRQAAERAAAYAKGRQAALALWRSSPVAGAGHPYLRAKRMTADGLRQSGRFLLVPMRHPRTGELRNVQRIASNGRKLFLPDARVSGLVWGRGEAGAVIVLCEGVATAAAVHAATGLFAVAAFSKSALPAAAAAIRTRWAAAALVIAADVDEDGGGQAAALVAARAMGGTVALPPRPIGWIGLGWDFADLWAANQATAIRLALGVGT